MKSPVKIRDAKTNEVLVDNLPTERALDVFEAYQNYFGVGSVKISHYEVQDVKHNISRTYENKQAQEYKKEYILYFEELYIMGNIKTQ